MAAKGHQQSATERQVTGALNSKPMLDPEGSAALREQLLAEVQDIASAEDAAIWAQRIMGAKNSLTAADARTSKTRSRPK